MLTDLEGVKHYLEASEYAPLAAAEYKRGVADGHQRGWDECKAAAVKVVEQHHIHGVTSVERVQALIRALKPEVTK